MPTSQEGSCFISQHWTSNATYNGCTGSVWHVLTSCMCLRLKYNNSLPANQHCIAFWVIIQIFPVRSTSPWCCCPSAEALYWLPCSDILLLCSFCLTSAELSQSTCCHSNTMRMKQQQPKNNSVHKDSFLHRCWHIITQHMQCVPLCFISTHFLLQTCKPMRSAWPDGAIIYLCIFSWRFMDDPLSAV